MYTENTSDAWHIPRYPTRKHCITSINVQVNVNIKVGAVKIAKSYKTTLVVITQPLSLHYVFISYNMKPQFLELIDVFRTRSLIHTPSLSWLQNLNFKFGALKREKRRAWPFIPEPRV